MFISSIHIKKFYLIVIIALIICFLFIAIGGILASEEKKYIKWVDFKVTSTILEKTSSLDIKSHLNNENIKYNCVELLAFLATKYGGEFSRFRQTDLDKLIARLKAGESMSDITKDMKNYTYFYEAYDAILSQFIGEYEIQTIDKDGNKVFTKKYGIKAFSPIAKNFYFNHCKDFGNSRSYGYQRKHLGNDLMGNIGTPIIAVESGTVEALGWNQYGGWRIGIRSFDKKRYYYYAHLRKGHPYNDELYEGKVVKAGDVIGYLGMTGYSSKEDSNNINTPHLHFGMQLIFDESQKDGINQIWIDVYNIVDFLNKNKSDVYYNKESKEYYRKYEFMDPKVIE
jgi:murein DD-endopeptidase MepM/ murein hydrolase activator NlpD